MDHREPLQIETGLLILLLESFAPSRKFPSHALRGWLPVRNMATAQVAVCLRWTITSILGYRPLNDRSKMSPGEARTHLSKGTGLLLCESGRSNLLPTLL